MSESRMWSDDGWSFHGKRSFKWGMLVCYLASVALIAGALWRWGALEVRGHLDEVIFLTVLGAAALIIALHLFAWLGLSVADDVFERHNPAAFIAIVVATFAVAMIYAAGSLGEGPSYWNNFFSAALGMMGLFALWLIVDLGGRISISITEERDLASGIRFSGFALAVAVIFSRAVAGNWHSTTETTLDFIDDGWPAVALCFLAVILERCLRPSRNRPVPEWKRCGLLPAMLYLTMAMMWIFHLGRWEGMPR